jgi:glycosyltransferase involved in cell wall biosynthesis
MVLKSKNRFLVSIITPFLNTEIFIKDSIESVLNQTYENWELMLIDDGSTDGSTSIAKHYVSLFPNKIFYLEHDNHQNLGASASRNLGIQHSKGEYIAFLDSDDVYLTTKLEEQVPLLNQQPEAGMLYSSTEYWHSWTGLLEDMHKDWVWNNFGVKPNTLVDPPNLLILFLLNGNTIPSPVSFLARREAIDLIGGWENTFKYIYTDQVFLAKMCLHFPVFVSSGCWDRYRQHSSSSCAFVKKSKQEFASKMNYFKWLEKYLEENEAKINAELQVVFKNLKRINRYPILYYIYNRCKNLSQKAKGDLKIILPKVKSVYSNVRFKYLRIGNTKFGNLRRVKPINRRFGFDRGLPIDRYYIEYFLKKHNVNIKGHVL